MENTKTIVELTPEQVIEKYKNGPAENGSINWKKRIRVNDIKKYWVDTIGVERMEEDETARITGILPYMSEGKIQVNQRTMTEQIRSAEELIGVMEQGYKGIRENDWKYLVGWSLSAARYKYIPANEEGKPVAPTKGAIVSIQSLVIDVDAQEQEHDGGRFHFNSYTPESRRLIAAHIMTIINNKLARENVDLLLKANTTYSTGGGLQFIFKFDRPLIMMEAENIFNYLKAALTTPIVVKDKDGKEIETDRIKVIGYDSLGKMTKSWLEFDKSSFDISHTQRVGGTVNPKEGYMGSFSEEIPELYNEDLLDDAKLDIFSVLDETLTEADKISSIKKFFNSSVAQFKAEYTHPTAVELIPADMITLDAQIMSKSRSTYNDESSELLSTPMDYDILKKITPAQQAELFEKYLGTPKKKNTRYNAYLSPFKNENNASFALYKNTNDVVSFAKDFHTAETYNLITFLMAVNKCSRSTATKEIIIHFKLELKGTDRKNFIKGENEGAVDKLIKKVDVENFVYYRLANKNRNCIIREFSAGESHMFDGTRMMSDHILLNQLGMHGADLELRSIFHDMFVEKILVNAFEEFRPGKPYTYERKFIKYINLWIPGKDYLKIHENAESIDQMDLASAILLVKERLPNIFFYLNQITQKGSLEYFMNWLVCVGKFEVMSTIPVLTSTQGTGKGVFVTQILEHYLNHEYVNTITSDKLAGNFNAFMERSSLLVLDEGDFSRSHDVDVLKLLSGNKYIQLEKKGVDSSKTERHFNMLMMTNGDSPMNHPSNDRRMTYFRLDVTLLDSVNHLGFEFIDDFIDALKDEVSEFWSILVKTTPKREWINANLKDNQFNKQILMMHPFGRLVIKILEDDWSDIQLQLNENIDDAFVITANLEMVKTIKETFERDGTIDLTLINKYIKSLPFKSFTSVQQFINNNMLGKNGISTITTSTSVKIHINSYKLKNLIKMSNNLGNLFDCYNDENYENTLALVNSHQDEENEAKVYALNNPQLEIEEGLNPVDSSDPLGIMKPNVPDAQTY